VLGYQSKPLVVSPVLPELLPSVFERCGRFALSLEVHASLPFSGPFWFKKLRTAGPDGFLTTVSTYKKHSLQTLKTKSKVENVSQAGIQNKRQLSTTDILAQATMKNAAKCDT
jgi:hypothetical protein